MMSMLVSQVFVVFRQRECVGSLPLTITVDLKEDTRSNASG